MKTIDDIIEMKNINMRPFKNKYIWLFKKIEDDLLSKSNGRERVQNMLGEYDYKAKLYIVYQIMYINSKLGHELYGILDIQKNNTFIEDKYIDEIILI